MYFHNSLIPRGAYFLFSLESKQEATSGWNFTKCISEVEVNTLKWKICMLEWAYPPLKPWKWGQPFYTKAVVGREANVAHKEQQSFAHAEVLGQFR